MSLVKWSPIFDSFDDMESILSNTTPAIRGARKAFVPAIDMYEDDKNVIVETELAGIDAEKVKVSIENDVLCIKGESEKKSEVDDKNYYRKEIRRGSFFRSIQLPTHVDGDLAVAETMDGVLKITVPKESKSKSKEIKIKKK
jgi:HSP20 family protein